VIVRRIGPTFAVARPPSEAQASALERPAARRFTLTETGDNIAVALEAQAGELAVGGNHRHLPADEFRLRRPVIAVPIAARNDRAGAEQQNSGKGSGEPGDEVRHGFP
jgi:hypothetical protein